MALRRSLVEQPLADQPLADQAAPSPQRQDDAVPGNAGPRDMAADMAADDELHFGWLTADVGRLMRTVFDRRVREHGLTRPQWQALTRLKRRAGASQSELAVMMEIEKAPCGRILDRMEEKGWLVRRPDPDDRRINRIHLTDRGEHVYATILPIATATVSDALSNLSAFERETVTMLLANVKSTLSALAGSDPASEISWAGDEADPDAVPAQAK